MNDVVLFPVEGSLFTDSPFGPNWDDPDVLPADDTVQAALPQKFARWNYLTYPGNDGAALIKQYIDDPLEKEAGAIYDNKVDINIYYERDDKYNTFGSVCFVKMDKALKDYISRGGSKSDPEWLAGAIMDDYVPRYKGDPGYPVMNEKKLSMAIQYELDKEKAGKSWLDVNLAAPLGEELHSLAEWIRGKKFTRDQWDPGSKNYLFKGVTEPLERLRSYNKDINEMLQRTVRRIGAFSDYLPDKVWKGIQDFAESLDKLSNGIEGVLAYVAAIGASVGVVIAFSCGLLNGLMDFIAGLVDSLSLLLLISDKAEEQKLEEGLENLLQTLRQEPGKIGEQITAAVKDFAAHYDAGKNSAYEIAYHAGEDIVTLLDIIITIVTIIGAIRKLAAEFKNLAEWIKAIIRKSPKLIFAELAEELSVLRSRLTKAAALTKWYNLVQHDILEVERVNALAKMREGIKGIENANVATMKVRGRLKSGEIFEKDYVAHAKAGKKIPGSVGAPEVKPADMEDFFDADEKKYRWYDSENKMLNAMDKDLYGLEVADMSIEIESTFTPCSVCKREILIRQQKYGAKVQVKSPKFKDAKGRLEHVTNNLELQEYLKQTKKK